jgi:hypothetical protein
MAIPQAGRVDLSCDVNVKRTIEFAIADRKLRSLFMGQTGVWDFV